MKEVVCDPLPKTSEGKTRKEQLEKLGIKVSSKMLPIAKYVFVGGALTEHAFSWTFMVHVPIIFYSIILGNLPNIYLFIALFIINWMIHTITDNAKANLMKINLIQDQWIHIAQIFATWSIYVVINR